MPDIDPSTELANLDAENARRMQDILSGKVGVPIQLPPGTFEHMKSASYLEYLIEHLLSSADLTLAKLRFADIVSDSLDSLETESRRAKLTMNNRILNGSLNGKGNVQTPGNQ